MSSDRLICSRLNEQVKCISYIPDGIGAPLVQRGDDDVPLFESRVGDSNAVVLYDHGHQIATNLITAPAVFLVEYAPHGRFIKAYQMHTRRTCVFPVVVAPAAIAGASGGGGTFVKQCAFEGDAFKLARQTVHHVVGCGFKAVTARLKNRTLQYGRPDDGAPIALRMETVTILPGDYLEVLYMRDELVPMSVSGESWRFEKAPIPAAARMPFMAETTTLMARETRSAFIIRELQEKIAQMQAELDRLTTPPPKTVYSWEDEERFLQIARAFMMDSEQAHFGGIRMLS